MMLRSVGLLVCVVGMLAAWSWAAEQTPTPVKITEKWVFVWPTLDDIFLTGLR